MFKKMSSLIKKITKIGKLLRALLPSPVPMGVSEFNAWSQDIIDLYGFPENDSVKFALATMIMHSGPTAAYRSKFYFALMIKAGAAKQVAHAVFQDIKTKQAEAAKAEAPATLAVVSNGSEK